MKKFTIILIAIYVFLMFLLFIYFKPFSFKDSSIGNLKSQQMSNKENKKVIKFISPLIDNPVWLTAKEGFDAASEKYDFYGIWTGTDDHSADKMISEIESAIDEKVDAIITCPFNPTTFTPVLEKAKAVGIPVIVLVVDAEKKTQRAAFIGTNSEECGKLQTEALHNKVGDDMKIGVIMTNLDSMNQVIQLNILKKYITKLKNASILAIHEDRGDNFAAMEVMNKMIDDNPSINCIFSTEGAGIPGLANVIARRGLQDKITVIGMDTTKPNLDAIRDGSIYGVMSQDYYNMGLLGGKYAYLKALGQDIPEIVYTKTELVTKQNLNEYK